VRDHASHDKQQGESHSRSIHPLAAGRPRAGAIATGAGSGNGMATAPQFGAGGAWVVVGDMSAVVAAIMAEGGRHALLMHTSPRCGRTMGGKGAT